MHANAVRDHNWSSVGALRHVHRDAGTGQERFGALGDGIAKLLSDSGYATSMWGKWHLGDTEGRLPTDQGFDEWWGYRNSVDEAGYSS